MYWWKILNGIECRKKFCLTSRTGGAHSSSSFQAVGILDWTLEQKKHSYLQGYFNLTPHNNCTLLLLEHGNKRAGILSAPETWFTLSLRIDLRYSEDSLIVVSAFKLVPYFRATLKLPPLISLYYRDRHLLVVLLMFIKWQFYAIISLMLCLDCSIYYSSYSVFAYKN